MELVWIGKCKKAFTKFKKCVSTTPLLQGPNWSLPFDIATDASNTTVGVVLGQLEEENHIPSTT